MFWVDGESQQTIGISDRSFQYGDGCFTTMLILGGKIANFSDHQYRVDECLKALKISPIDWKIVTVWLNNAIQSKPSSNDSRFGLKLHISRGAGGRGYSSLNVSKPMVTISSFDYPSHYNDWHHDGVQLGICNQALGLSPLLAGHKHNNRLEQILMKSEMDEVGEVDGVVLDISGHVIETTMANLFWRIQDKIYTPKLTQSGVAGVMRKQVLMALDSTEQFVKIGDYHLDQLIQADEVFMTNSILGIAPITRIRNTHFKIGPVTRSLQGQLNS
ncbi:aminodeoxychorismate lyase [Vibrio sp. 99-70-13A1]|uniref:aminodeoxychorismate lyase n=1 Tax=Vibrio sp. 99-70-13A1 TaxID=2607601 RepID=UPI0014939DBA|nr:aminodeoxychorismate lyase [Vibrio sp. 99-70-13A1]NOH95364.1 aminodeoxychorismate lyase [Vibrio sp. 99-70-13A1]